MCLLELTYQRRAEIFGTFTKELLVKDKFFLGIGLANDYFDGLSSKAFANIRYDLLFGLLYHSHFARKQSHDGEVKR